MKLKTILPFAFMIIVPVMCGKQKNPTPKVDLHAAAVTGNLDAVRQHIEAGSNLDVKEHTRGSTPLITATVFGKTDIALALIEGGADINIQNNEGSTPLITAAVFCRTEIVQALLDIGADKTIRNIGGHTALDAVSRPFVEMKGFYDVIQNAFAPLGFKLDYERIKVTRPMIAQMLN